MSTVPKFPAPPANLFCSARPGINVLQTLYNGLNFVFVWGGGRWRKGHKPLMKILLSTGIICNFINVQSQNPSNKKIFSEFWAT